MLGVSPQPECLGCPHNHDTHFVRTTDLYCFVFVAEETISFTVWFHVQKNKISLYCNSFERVCKIVAAFILFYCTWNHTLRAIQKYVTLFGPNLTPYSSVTNCHIWLPPIKNMSQATIPPDSMHLTDFCIRNSITTHISLFMFVFMYSCMHVNQY